MLVVIKQQYPLAYKDDNSPPTAEVTLIDFSGSLAASCQIVNDNVIGGISMSTLSEYR